MADSSRLFKPLKIGNIELKHRLGMAPMTRLRADYNRVPTPMMKEYYGQRAVVPGTLIVTEGTFVSAKAAGNWPTAPGIWTPEQIEGWRAVVDEVHSKGSFIICQLFASGRVATTEVAAMEGIRVLGPSPIPFKGGSPVEREMTREEIKEMIAAFGTAAKNAIDAGFDGVECHGGNGYLIDQFIQDNSNQRSDEYGGSVENRSRFCHEAMRAMVDAVGADKVGLRLTPWSTFQDMRMADPIPQFTDVVKKAAALDLAYLHLVESRIAGSDDQSCTAEETLDFGFDNFKGPLLIAGGYKGPEARKLVDEMHPDRPIVVIIARFFVSNPDLVFRIKEGLELTKYDRSKFYTPMSPDGYVDWRYSEEYLASQAA
jgi:NADPH2 dehydrogenase